jgi:ArsR family transcriptional regulator
MSTREALPLTPVGSCCTPVTADVLTADDAASMAIAFKALGDPTRLRLLSIVAASEGDEACVCDLTEPIGLSQPTVSHHLKILMDAGYLTRSKRGTWAYYKLVPGSLDRVAALLATATASTA